MKIALRLKMVVVDLLQWTGVRDRLRCPQCKAVGTWKPHGGWWDREDKRRVPRWLCKWCGHYVGPEGVRRAIVDNAKGHWTLLEDLTPGEPTLTPQSVINDSPIPGTWPWRG